MTNDFVRTNVLIIICVLLISSFGSCVTGKNQFVQNDVEIKIEADSTLIRTTLEPSTYKTTSRATGPKPGSMIRNDGDPVNGFFLGKINPDFTNDYSTLDNYMTEEDLETPNVKDIPAFPGTTDIVYDLTLESVYLRDDNGANGDDVLYIQHVGVDLNKVEVRNEINWTWTSTATPFGEIAGSEHNIINTTDSNWVTNDLKINGIPAYEYNPYLSHYNARWRISNNNTVTNENYMKGSGGTGTVNNVWVPEVFNNSVGNEWMDVYQDTYLNDTPDNPATSAIEYRDLIKIKTGPKVFDGFTLDVLPEAEPGVYRFPVSIGFNNQSHSPLPTKDQEMGLKVGNLHNTGSFGDFAPYFWIPYNLSTNQIITDLTDENMNPNIFDKNENCSFIKDEVYLIANERDDLDGFNSWEPIPDNSTSLLRKWNLSSYFDHDGDDYDSSGDDLEKYNWRVYPNGTDNFQTDWNNNRHLLGSDNGNGYETGTYPRGYPIPDWDYGFYSSGISADDDGNGTWQHSGLIMGDWSGYEGDVIWYNKIETYWVQITIFAGENEPPAVPVNLNIEPISASDALYITWNPNTDDTISYEIYWESPVSSNWEMAFYLTHPKSNYIFTNEKLINNHVYSFKIRARDKFDALSNFSGIVNVIHKDQLPPEPPDYLKAETLSESSIKLIWYKGIESDIEGYEIFINNTGQGSGGPYKLFARVGSINYTLKGLEENTSYYFVLCAFDEADNPSSYSNEAWNTTSSLKLPDQPQIIKTYPENNSINIPIDIAVVITFNLSMDNVSITDSISINPVIEFNLRWSNKDTVLFIEFETLLSQDTEYSISISGGEGKEGGVLQNTPFTMKFKTSKESVPDPKQPSIVITSPANDAIVQEGDSIIVSGTSTGFEENSEIIIIIDGISVSGFIGENGNWSFVVSIPDQAGNYNLTVTVGNNSQRLRIIVEESPETEEEDDEAQSEPKNKRGLTIGLIVSIIVICIIFLILYFIIIKKKGAENVDENIEERELVEEEAKSIEDEDIAWDEAKKPFNEND
jgi:hypothetical protein